MNLLSVNTRRRLKRLVRDDYSLRLRLWALVTLTVLIVSAIFAALLSVAIVISGHSCDEKAEQLGLESKYSIWTDCLVEVRDGTWIDIDRVFVNEEGEIGG